jgi:hypothetical protein
MDEIEFLRSFRPVPRSELAADARRELEGRMSSGPSLVSVREKERGRQRGTTGRSYRGWPTALSALAAAATVAVVLVVALSRPGGNSPLETTDHGASGGSAVHERVWRFSFVRETGFALPGCTTFNSVVTGGVDLRATMEGDEELGGIAVDVDGDSRRDVLRLGGTVFFRTALLPPQVREDLALTSEWVREDLSATLAIGGDYSYGVRVVEANYLLGQPMQDFASTPSVEGMLESSKEYLVDEHVVGKDPVGGQTSEHRQARFKNDVSAPLFEYWVNDEGRVVQVHEAAGPMPQAFEFTTTLSNFGSQPDLSKPDTAAVTAISPEMAERASPPPGTVCPGL